MIGPTKSLASVYGDEQSRWEAVMSRDPRSDGAFLYAVTTTGIVCRPVCTARRPKRYNTRFFNALPQALSAGFRPCRLCRPDQAGRAHGLAAILMTDLKGFSTHVARHDPGAALRLLAGFHEMATEAVLSRGGQVHKFLGDGLMAVFPAVPHDRNEAASALAAAQHIVAANAARSAAGVPQAAVGLHYGAVAIGEVGARAAREIAVIGPTVNIAARLEQLTRRRDVDLAVSDDALRAAGAEAARGLEALGTVSLKGCGRHRVWVQSARQPDAVAA
ncbi:MAG: Ada metal-binding domain-containing protein [Pseudomonadota bacterium]